MSQVEHQALVVKLQDGRIRSATRIHNAHGLTGEAVREDVARAQQV
jgi:hypothetical protein